MLPVLIIRLILSLVFILHGSQKVFGWFGGSGIAAFTGWIKTLGIPQWLGYVAAYTELIGGLMIGLGVATELAALALALNMCAAIFLVHWQHGFFNHKNGFEYPLVLLLLCIALMLS